MNDLEIDTVTTRLNSSLNISKIYEYEENIEVLMINSKSENEDN
ncbi:MAG: hypothetical protein R3321_08420 [Nitrososphaeraceae archaeon]|nr:hypothetical protein [Nitrososphaeraceae archaeon]